MKRFILNVLAMSLALTLWAPRIAAAQTGYIWSDISGQLTERTNRPVWAMARAGSYWFYTDGQDLWNGGQVYRYDGTTQVNITLDVRSAGLTRVDDIVSDGSSVLFLKNVVRRDNSFEILKWNGSTYSGVGGYVRNSLASDEGLASITGRNGTWYIATTKGRLLTWDGNKTNPVQVLLPADVRSTVADYSSATLYNVNHGSRMVNSQSVVLAVVPIEGNLWLVAARGNNGLKFYKFNGSSFTDVTSSLPSLAKLDKITSNGSTAVLVAMSGTSNGGKIVSYNGSTVSDVSGNGIDPNNSSSIVMGWNGKSWMLINTYDKTLFRLTATNLESLEKTTDYLFILAGDADGHFMVGGAVSVNGYAAPTNPLTAKLLWVTEGELSTNTTVTTGGSFGGDRTYTSANGPKVIAQGNPSDFRVGNGKEFSYRVTATDGDGVDRTDLYVNDARIKTCYADTCEFRTTYWTSGVTTKAVKFWVRSTDKRGYSTDTSTTPDYLTVDSNSTATAGGTVTTSPSTSGTTASGTAVKDGGTGISSWIWLDPTGETTLNSGETVTWNVGAFDDNGIKRIEIIVNGVTQKTCELNNAKGNQTCAAPVYADDYPAGTSIYVNAKVTDGDGKYTYSSATTIWRNAGDGSGNTSVPANGDVSAWNWFDPAGELKRGNVATFRAGAWAKDGLSSMELYVNGSLKKTCSFSRAYGNQDCYVAVYGSDYAAGTQIAANVKAVDANGKVAWSELKYVNVIDANAASGSSYSGTNNAPVAWDWIEIAKDFITVDDKAKYVTGAWDENGIASIAFYVNGDLKHTIWLGTAYGNQQSSYEIMGLNYPVGSSVFVNAKVTDATGKETWTTGKNFKVMGTGATTSADYANNGAVTSWSNKATYSSTDYVYVTGNGSDPDGVSRAEIYVNGERMKTCTYDNQKNVSCESTVGPFPNLSIATYAVTIFDRYGYQTTTGYKQVAIVK